MKKTLLALFFSLTSLTTLATPIGATENFAQKPPASAEQCAADVPFGMPVDNNNAHTVIICRKAYMLEHDNVAKIPKWVSYVLTPMETEGCLKRADDFKPDFSLPAGQRAELSDYRNSGYDKGHIANNADMSWDVVAEHESFILSNMTPQVHPFNAGIWKDLETATRSWAFNRQHSMLIYAGPIYAKTDKTIGKGQVVVPPKFYKVVTDIRTGETLSFIFVHEGEHSKNLSDYLTTLAEVEKETGIKFDIPGSKTTVGTLWPIDDKKFEADKKRVCSLKQ